ncbi:hypothetical protein [Mucilaginibacter sp.]|uniref:hypothetical protein n=1 Tax=Mucilaginibacter sp. TaxID=1882438 RepID=UPI002611EA9F|nr:hypothetical protein [Mucilaginibacter sp.]MDB5029717.1 hypothetical protein [Mucilaginibacter sp.]
METIAKTNNTDTQNELAAILTDAVHISRDNQLKEICSEALLLAIFNNEPIAAKLLKMGFNIFMFKRLLAEKLKTKAIDTPPLEPPYSVAIDGLLILTAMDKSGRNNGLKLLKTIIKNNNTAAARLLKAERITLNSFNELVYKPIIN